MKRLFFSVIIFSTLFGVTSAEADDHTWEDYKKERFREGGPSTCRDRNRYYPPKWLPWEECEFGELERQDWELKKKINNDELWEKWITGRNAMCAYSMNEIFGTGRIKSSATIGCMFRLNAEMQKGCISLEGHNKTCG